MNRLSTINIIGCVLFIKSPNVINNAPTMCGNLLISNEGGHLKARIPPTKLEKLETVIIYDNINQSSLC